MGCLPVVPAKVRALTVLCFLVCKSRRDIICSRIQANTLSCGGIKMSDVR